MRRVVGLETRTAIALTPGPDLTVRADPDQLEQLLINLLRNAVDAALETGGGVSVGWARRADQLEVCIRDEGPGLSNTSNLFVPFFTTKPTGSGIGLVLSRQIAEAHGGSLTLENRKDRAGCEARLRLPLQGTRAAVDASDGEQALSVHRGFRVPTRKNPSELVHGLHFRSEEGHDMPGWARPGGMMTTRSCQILFALSLIAGVLGIGRAAREGYR